MDKAAAYQGMYDRSDYKWKDHKRYEYKLWVKGLNVEQPIQDNCII